MNRTITTSRIFRYIPKCGLAIKFRHQNCLSKAIFSSKRANTHRLGFIRSQGADRTRLFFIPALIADTFRALDIARLTRIKHLECCTSLVQVWFLEHMTICLPMSTKGIFMKTWSRPTSTRRPKRISKNGCLGSLSERFEERASYMAYMVTWYWVLMYGDNKDPIALIDFHGIEGYSPVHVVRQFGWVQPIPLIMDFSRFTLKMTRAI